jgi:uncharacterized protein (TIGR03663 family)
MASGSAVETGPATREQRPFAMSSSRLAWVFLGPILLAAALRLPALASRPMHCDEAVHADKLGTLLQGGGYVYDPSEYHGPTLYYMTLLPAWLQGAKHYVEIDEITVRSATASVGVVLVASHLLARAALGTPAAAAAALLVAISPAMVYYSRYYIHEMPLVLFSFGALVAASWYLRRPGAGSAILGGVCVGLMHATKETAPIAVGAILLALALTVFVERRRGEAMPPIRTLVRNRDLLLAMLSALLVSVLLFSSFFGNPRGPLDSLRAYALYLERANAVSWHFHPWHYYLGLLIHFPSRGTPLWTEALIIGLALLGCAAGWRGKGVPGADPRALRFLSFYTLLMVAAYSAIPYKTPWCLLGFLHGMILLAGAGAAFLTRAFRSVGSRVLVVALLAAVAAHLGWQAYSGSFVFGADPRNPYVYAHTGPDVFLIARRVEALARVRAGGPSLPIQVISRENLWPLPWYFRRLSGVGWWNSVPDQAPSAPVVLVTPDMEPSLVRRLYELPPPGERELYVSIFETPVELRPQVELRGYAAKSLWDEYLRVQTETPASAVSPFRE